MSYGNNGKYGNANNRNDKQNKSVKTFINPYNFVSLDPKKTVKRENAFNPEEELLSGVVECSLTTRTPLAIPDTQRKTPDEENREHYSYPFYRIGEQYTIPGSSIRGVLRNVYETVTDSCFRTTNKDERLNGRELPKEALKKTAGLLSRENGEWVLYKAEKYKLLTLKKKDPISEMKRYEIRRDATIPYICDMDGNPYTTGSKVSFNESKDSFNRTNESIHYISEITKAGEKTGYLSLGEMISSKLYDGVFVPGDKAEIDNSAMKLSQAVHNLKECIRIYQDEKVNTNLGSKETPHDGYKGLMNAINAVETMEDENAKEIMIPIYYKERNTGIELTPAMISRKVFMTTMMDLIGDKKPCTDGSALCKACRLFGMIGKGSANGSRVRITDAIADSSDITTKKVTLKELASPKPSYMLFYAKAGNATEQDYDSEGVQIRGRKYYWHTLEKKYESKEKTKRNATMELVLASRCFSFKIFFDEITEETLRELIWVICLGDMNDDNSCHKIGHGKPLGLGSVRMKVNSVRIRQYGQEDVWKDGVSYDLKGLFSENQSIVDEVRKITSLRSNANGRGVRYPYVTDSTDKERPDDDNKYAAHQWFSKNKGQKDMKMKLPAIGSANMSLSVIKIPDNNKGGYKS